jgi:three-Cys-motif partner protein
VTKHTRFGVEAEFFKKLRESSRIKQKIVIQYFVAYNRVMARDPREKVGFADLFSGPGIYTDSDGVTQNSIPVLVCEAVVREELFRRKVHLWFNDGDRDNYEQLKTTISSIPGIQDLQYKPTIGNKVVDAGWIDILSRLRVPTLVFLDPCGYKGLSLNLIAAALKGFGNDCIFFFNYSRINMKLELEMMNESIDEFFGSERAKTLRRDIKHRSRSERKRIILDAVGSAIVQAGGHPQFFTFKSDTGRTSHHLVYASKSLKAGEMMKRILVSASSEITEGVGSGEYNPRIQDMSGSLFSGLYEVEDRLLSTYAGREISFDALLQAEATMTQYTESNYRDALLKLEGEGRIIMDPPAENRRWQAGREKRTLPKTVLIRFVTEEGHGE